MISPKNGTLFPDHQEPRFAMYVAPWPRPRRGFTLIDQTTAVLPQNQFGVAQKAAMFLCPSDTRKAVYDGTFGPTNYIGCLGNGATGGTRTQSDGVFYQNSKTKLADIVDGTSNTAL